MAGVKITELPTGSRGASLEEILPLVQDGVTIQQPVSDISALLGFTPATGFLAMASGGTNANLTPSIGGIFYSTATAGAILSGTATAGQVLRSGSSAAPAWSTAVYPATAASGSILAANSANTLTAVTSVAAGTYLLKNVTGTISWGASNALLALDDLTDVAITTPTLDQVLKFDGSNWINGAGTNVSGGPGIEFYNATPVIVARTSPGGISQDGTSGNGIQINTLSKVPIVTAEQTQAGQAVSDTRAFAAWLYDTALGRTSLDAGVWQFETYCAVNSVAAGRVTTLTRAIYQVVVPASGTVTVTGASANSRTATASAGTPFAASGYFAASATNTTASYLYLPSGLYQISARTSDTEVTIIVPTGYVNEGPVSYTVWNKLLSSTTDAITSTGTAYELKTFSTVQGAFSIAVTDKLGSIGFVTSNNTTTLTLAYNGTTHSSHFSTPLVTLHGNLAGLQGGTGSVPTEQYYHLTSAQHTIATQAATGALAGYLASADWTTFNSKAASGANTDISSIYLNNTGLKVKDTNASHGLIIAPGSDLTADKTLTLTTGDSDRTITLSGNPSMGDYFDQAVKTSSSPSFTAATAGNINLATNSIITTNVNGNLVLQPNGTGQITTPVQAAFEVYASSDLLNVTGDGTVYTILFDAERQDIGNNYNTGTGIFTASVSGFYLFSWQIQATGIAVGHTELTLQLVTSVTSYSNTYINPSLISPSGVFGIGSSLTVYLAATQTAKINFTVSGSTSVVDLGGVLTMFSGRFLG